MAGNIHFALIDQPELCHRGQRVIYTTPLKALSNQKLFEMREQFGHKRVGLQTGDASLNAEGQVVVMTTEVLRNIMYHVDASSPTGVPCAFPAIYDKSGIKRIFPHMQQASEGKGIVPTCMVVLCRCSAQARSVGRCGPDCA